MVDVGAYTEQGEWTDGFLHMGQIKDDGGYVAQAGCILLTAGRFGTLARIRSWILCTSESASA